MQDTHDGAVFPRRAIVEMSATSSVRPVAPELVARLGVKHWMDLVTVAAPSHLRLKARGHSDNCGDCECGPNPVDIIGPRREIYMTGRRAQRLVLGWAMKQPNPADLDAAGTPRPYHCAWDAFRAEAERAVTDSARLAGLPEELVSLLRFSGGALIEPMVERLAAWMVPASRRQPPHVDARRKQLQAVFNVGLGPCESTHVYKGDYVAAGPLHAEAQHADLADVAATLCQPRAVVDACMKPVAVLQPGEGACFVGDVIHAGAGNAEGEWRVVYFLTATWGEVMDYDADSQHSPWTLAVEVLRDIQLANELSYAYREFEPWRNFADAGVKRKVQAYCEGRAKLEVSCDFSKRV